MLCLAYSYIRWVRWKTNRVFLVQKEGHRNSTTRAESSTASTLNDPIKVHATTFSREKNVCRIPTTRSSGKSVIKKRYKKDYENCSTARSTGTRAPTFRFYQVSTCDLGLFARVSSRVEREGLSLDRVGMKEAMVCVRVFMDVYDNNKSTVDE